MHEGYALLFNRSPVTGLIPLRLADAQRFFAAIEILLLPSGDSRLPFAALAFAGGFLESELEACELSASFARSTDCFADASKPPNPFESPEMPSMMFDNRDSTLFKRFRALRAFMKSLLDWIIALQVAVRDCTTQLDNVRNGESMRADLIFHSRGR